MTLPNLFACGVAAAAIIAAVPATAQELAAPRSGPELFAGAFRHGVNFHPLGSELVFPEAPPGQIYEGDEEKGTLDVQIGVRSAPLRVLLKPRLTGKVQISTAGRTSFASVGAEWRQHLFTRRVYVQGGIGVTIHDGYRFTPDPFAPGLSEGEAPRRYDIYLRRTSFGSRVLFNPNASLGVRLDPRWAVELAWEHFSHRQIFSDQNPGIDHLGIRVVRTLKR